MNLYKRSQPEKPYWTSTLICSALEIFVGVYLLNIANFPSSFKRFPKVPTTI